MDRIGNLTRLTCTLLYVMTTHAYVYIYCTSSVYPQLPPVIGAPWGCCGHASGISFPHLLWFGGCATHATPCSVPGYSYYRMCLGKSERNCLTSYLYDAAILASLFFFACLKGCFRLSLSIRNKKKRTVTNKKHASRPANLLLCLKKNLNAPRPSEHPPVRGKKCPQP